MITEIWVDGSFSNDTPCWAILVKQDNVEVFSDSGTIDDPKLKRYNQVVGELTAAKKALQWCADNNVKDVTIHYDYEGIRSWATKAWKANNPLTKEYVDWTALALKTMNVVFNKVKAHSGNENNNIVDKMAKLASAVVITETGENIIELTYKQNKYVINFNEMSIKPYDEFKNN